MLTLKKPRLQRSQDWGNTLALTILLVLSTAYPLSCQTSGPARVNVHLVGTSPDTDSITVTFSLDGTPDARSPVKFQNNTTYFGIDIHDPGPSGSVIVAVQTFAQTCLIGEGQTQVIVSTGQTYEVNINFNAMTKACPLTIKKSGDGSVKSDVSGIDCGSTCSARYPVGTRVALNAIPAIAGTPFQWGGMCNGNGNCAVTIDAASTVSIDFTPRVCTAAGFCWENPRPQGAPLYNSWTAPDGTLYAVGAYGTILGGNGATWSLINSGTAQYLFGIWGSSTSDIWAVGANGTIIHFDGSTWKTSTSNTTSTLRAIWGSSPSDIWVAGNSTILHYNGTAWTPSAYTGGQSLYSVWGSGPNDVWIVGDSKSILHNTGAGFVDASGTTDGDFRSVWGTGPADIWAVGTSAYKWNGTAWSLVPRGGIMSGDFLYSIWGSGSNTVWGSGGGGRIYRWNGSAWSLATMLGQSSSNLSSISGAGQRAWAVGLSGEIAQLVGGTWQLATSPPEKDFYAVWMNSSTDGWAVGAGGIMYHSQDGLTWTPLATSPTTADLFSLWGSGIDNVWAVGNGTILRYDGTKWSPIAVSGGIDISTHPLSSVYGTGPNDIWIAGYRMGTVTPIVLHWDGTALTVMPTPPDAASIVVFKTEPYVSMPYGTTGIYKLTGGSWTKVYDLPPASLTTSGGILFAASSGGIFRFDGTTWTMDMSGSYSPIYASSATSVWAWGTPGALANRLVKWDGSKWSVFDNIAQAVNGIGGNGTTDTWLVGQKGAILHLHQ